MPGWSRQRSESKLSAWAQSQDLATVERELERAEKDLRRSGSVSLNPEYVLKRQQERARAREATNRLSSIGVRLDLGPFLFDRPPPPPPTPVSNSKTGLKQNIEQHELFHLKSELAKLKARESELEYALAKSERKREEERNLHERERKLMISTIRKYKSEIEDSWNRLARLREKYEGTNRFPIESNRPSANRIYETDESFERTYRPSSGRVSLDEPARRPMSLSSSRRPSSANLSHLASHAQSARNPSGHSSKPSITSILKNPLDGPPRSRRTSFS